jgi:hypothetical protein
LHGHSQIGLSKKLALVAQHGLLHSDQPSLGYRTIFSNPQSCGET